MNDRDQIIGAANIVADGTWNALCLAFAFSDREDRRLQSRGHLVLRYLRSLGGRTGTEFFWPLDETGRNQRLVFLAFMLAWLE